MISTKPFVFIMDPIMSDSRHPDPVNRAASEHPPILPAMTVNKTIKKVPHPIAVERLATSVRRPEYAK